MSSSMNVGANGISRGTYLVNCTSPFVCCSKNAREPYGVSPTSVSVPGCFCRTASKLPPPFGDVAFNFCRTANVPGIASGGGSSAAVGGAIAGRSGGAVWWMQPAAASRAANATAHAVRLVRLRPILEGKRPTPLGSLNRPRSRLVVKVDALLTDRKREEGLVREVVHLQRAFLVLDARAP